MPRSLRYIVGGVVGGVVLLVVIVVIVVVCAQQRRMGSVGQTTTNKYVAVAFVYVAKGRTPRRSAGRTEGPAGNEEFRVQNSEASRGRE